jgi:ribosomal protein S27AE
MQPQDTTRRCTQCGEQKPPDAFYREKRSPSGLTSACTSCIRAQQARSYQQNPEPRRAAVAAYRRANYEAVLARAAARRRANPEYMARYREANAERLTAQSADWRRRHPEEVRQANAATNARLRREHPEEVRVLGRARQAVYVAVKKGTLIRPDTCEQCGQVRKITAAHHDYARPLDVRWLCSPCHVRWDRAEPKLFR